LLDGYARFGRLAQAPRENWYPDLHKLLNLSLARPGIAIAPYDLSLIFPAKDFGDLAERR
jgi:hypothetical protein